MKLVPKPVEKPWGRRGLPPRFAQPGADQRIGEIWFAAPEGADGGDLPLLIKYIFTSEALSVQVHPDDAQAHARGLPHGKAECWYILDAEPDAKLGLGFTREVGETELRAAALDGSIETLMAWHDVAAGDFFSVPAGTVHAIGAGISLIEVQQPSDVTYRLYDYGRPRELHLDDAAAVARRTPYAEDLARHGTATGPLLEGPYFDILRAGPGTGDPLPHRDRFLLPLAGTADGAGPGDCLWLRAGETLDLSPDAALLVAAPPVTS